MAKLWTIVRFASLGCVLVVAAAGGAARAEGDLRRFQAPLVPTGLLATSESEVLFPDQYTVGLTLDYARNPLVWRYADGSYTPIIGQQLNLEVAAAVGLMPLVDIAVALPLSIMQRGSPDAGLGDLRGAAIGDLRLAPRVALLPERVYGLGVTAVAEVIAPTGDATTFRGERGWALRPALLGSLSLARVRLLGQLSYLARPDAAATNLQLADEVGVSFGAALPLSSWHVGGALLAEASGSTSVLDPFSGGLSALETRLGWRGRWMKSWLLTTGLGAGVTRAVGTPSYRVLLAVSYAPQPPDRDGDGIPDGVDACPDNPEDYDRFADLDGCPDEDNDNDGIRDVDDACPNVPEDFNGISDLDGCPEGDRPDSDGDGIPDDVDQCPQVKEDFDSFEDGDGCPDPDNDQDGVPDEDDQCPTEKETINGREDYDGCPDEGEGVTEYVAEQRIEIKETIHFETAKADIKVESQWVLNQVALQILAHPEIELIRIEGHTDSVGAAPGNLALSQARAESVRNYIIGQNVDKARLEAIGFGEDRPIDSNDTIDGRARNRRVEFVIVRSRKPK